MPPNKKKKARKDVPAAGNADAIDGNVPTSQESVISQESNIGLSKLETKDLFDLKQSSATELWEKIRKDLKLTKREFANSRVATLVSASGSGNAGTGDAVLVSFYDDDLGDCTGQLALKTLLDVESKSLTAGVEFKHWPNSTSSLKPILKYFSSDCRDNGYPPSRYAMKELIAKYATATVEHTNQITEPFNEEKFFQQFFGSFHPPLTANSDTERDKQANIKLENVIETDKKITKVHMFLYKRRLDNIVGKVGRTSVLMHWGLIFKFEKSQGDTYWTLDGSREKGKSSKEKGQFVVWAHRCPPPDIGRRRVKKDNRTVEMPRVTYYGFVNSSARDIMKRAKKLMTAKFQGRYHLIKQNCQEWAMELLDDLTSCYYRYRYGPKTLESRYFDEFGIKKSTTTSRIKRKRNSKKGGTGDYLERPIDVNLVKGRTGEVVKTLGLVKTYDELLRNILYSYGLVENMFSEKRYVKLFKIVEPKPGMLVKIFRQPGQMTPIESYTISTLRNEETGEVRGLSIARFVGDPGDLVRVGQDELREEVETCLPLRALLEWCAMVQQWQFGTDRKYCDERYAKKLIDSLRPIPTSATVRKTRIGALLTLQPAVAGCRYLRSIRS